MKYKDEDMEHSEEDLMNVQSNIPFELYGNTAEAEKNLWKSWQKRTRGNKRNIRSRKNT